MLTKNRLDKIITKIEKEENVKVLFLIESGSRAWGFESKDSDYDVRGVFIQDYNTFLDGKEQVSKNINDIDIELWDLKKFLRLMTKSNPSVWEWLSSDIVYRDHKIRSRLKEIYKNDFNSYALSKHYASMAKQNFNKYINGIGDVANLKKYAYVLRSIACVNWIQNVGTPPPKSYKETISLLPSEVEDFLSHIIHRKKESESLEGPRNKEVEQFAISYFTMTFPYSTSMFKAQELNEVFKDAIKS